MNNETKNYLHDLLYAVADNSAMASERAMWDQHVKELTLKLERKPSGLVQLWEQL